MRDTSIKGPAFFWYVASMAIAARQERELILKYQPVFVEPHRDLIKPTPHHGVVRTLARILGFYIETVFELVRVSNKEFGFLAARLTQSSLGGQVTSACLTCFAHENHQNG